MTGPVGHVVVEPAVARAMLAGTVTFARAVSLDQGDLIRVCDGVGDDVLVVTLDDSAQLADEIARSSTSRLRVVCAVIGGEICCFAPGIEGEYLPVDVTVLPERVDVFDRVRGVFETDILRDRSAAVLGLGSGGSTILRDLARSGVGRFLLVDDDRVETGNVCRHESGLSDVGRLKTNAATDMVLNRNPAAEVCSRNLRIGGDTIDELSTVITNFGVDVVVCATDNRPSRLLVNRLCVLDRLPAIYAGVFGRAYGGQVLRSLPNLSPCYQCFVSALPAMAANREISSDEDARAIAYSDRPVAVEPGLVVDIAPISQLVTKLAILELLGDAPTTLDSLKEDLVAPLYLWLNRREVETEYASMRPMATGVEEMSVLRWYGIELPRNPSCAACGEVTLEGVPVSAALCANDFRGPADL